MLNHTLDSDLILQIAKDLGINMMPASAKEQLGLGPPASGLELPGARFGVPRHQDKDITPVKRRSEQGRLDRLETKD